MAPVVAQDARLEIFLHSKPSKARGDGQRPSRARATKDIALQLRESLLPDSRPDGGVSGAIGCRCCTGIALARGARLMFQLLIVELGGGPGNSNGSEPAGSSREESP